VIEYPGDTPGRGGWYRNNDGEARVAHPDGGKRICIYGGGSSFWSISKPYTGPAIYGEQGQQVHDITDCADQRQPLSDELIERGEALGLSREYQNYIYASYITFRKSHGFGEPLYIEKHYVNDGWKVASNIDRVDVVDGLIEFGDTKTATDPVKPDYVVQLATMVDGVPYDVITSQRGEWPHPINRDRANIFWIPVRRGMKRDKTGTWVTNDDRSTWPSWALYRVNLVAAVTLGQRVVDLRETDVTDSFVATSTLEQLRQHVRDVFSDADRDALRAYFDANDIDTGDIEQVSGAIAAVEGFRDVQVAPVERIVVETQAPPPERTIDEGPDLGDAEIAAAGKRYGALDDVVRSWVSACGAKVRLSPAHGGVASVRRFELLRGLCQLAETGFDTDDMVRACAALTTLGDDAWRRGTKVADVVAAMTLADAVRFAKACDIVTTGDVAIAWELDGRAVISPSVMEVAA